MINIVVIKKNTSIVDKVFSFGIKIVQKFLINGVGIKLRRKVLKNRTKFASGQEFNTRLKNLGLVPEKLWWGPMTLNPLKVKFLLDEIERQPPKQVLEVGSGTSSALFSAAGEKYGFNVLSLENFYPTIDYVKYSNL